MGTGAVAAMMHAIRHIVSRSQRSRGMVRLAGLRKSWVRNSLTVTNVLTLRHTDDLFSFRDEQMIYVL